MQLGVWVAWAMLFPLIAYRHTRALGVALLHQTGDVYWEPVPVAVQASAQPGRNFDITH
jgi:hypothetical protein